MKLKLDLLSIFMIFAAIAVMLFCRYVFFNHFTYNDHAEHIHSAWLVWQGQVPYKDFFQHHNPLMWYVLAPIVALFYKNIYILYASRIITCLVYSGMFWGMYKISSKFLNSSIKAFILSLILYFSIFEHSYILFELQPDCFMLCSYVWGLYFLFNYIENKKQIDLNISFCLFVVSFLFLQKILILLFFTGIWVLYLLYNKKIKFISIAKALILPSIILLIFIGYLIYFDMIDIYYKLNYTLNYYMQFFLETTRIFGNVFFYRYIPIAGVVCAYFFINNKNQYRVFLCYILLLDYIQKYFLGAPHIQYFILNNLIVCIMIADILINKLNKKISLALLLTYAIFIINFIKQNPPNKYYQQYYNIQEFVISDITKDDYAFNNIVYINLYAKNEDYYWYARGGVAPVSAYLFDYKPDFNFEYALRSKKPKYIFFNGYVNAIAILTDKDEFKLILEKIWKKLPVTKDNKQDFIDFWTRESFYVLDREYTANHYKPIYNGRAFGTLYKRIE